MMRPLLLALALIASCSSQEMKPQVSTKIDLDAESKEPPSNVTATVNLVNTQQNRTDERGDACTKKQTGNKRNTYIPMVINQIHIFVDDDEITLVPQQCKNGLCNVAVFSKFDEDGNLIVDSHIVLSVVRKPKNCFTPPEVPVVIGYTRPAVPARKSYPSPQVAANTILRIPLRQADRDDIHPWPKRPSVQGRYPYNDMPRRPYVDDKIDPPFSATNKGYK